LTSAEKIRAHIEEADMIMIRPVMILLLIASSYFFFMVEGMIIFYYNHRCIDKSSILYYKYFS